MPDAPNFNGFFKEFKKDSRIFADYRYLTPEFHPENLIDREDQVDRIWNELLYALNHNSISKNFFLYGPPGSGKTETMEFLIHRINHWGIEQNHPKPLIAYNNCALYNTAYRILRELCNLLQINIPLTGIATEVAYSRFLKAAKTSKEAHIILILDELDILFENKKGGNNLLYKLIRHPSSENNPLEISLIGITNDLRLINYFDLRVKSSLNLEEIYFPPYTALELQKILHQRAIKAFRPDALDQGIIEFIAAHFAQNNGDARTAITVLRTAGELADKANESKVLEKHARFALDSYIGIQRQEIIKSLPFQIQIILQSIIKLQERKKIEIPITGEIYQEYTNLCNAFSYPVLSTRQFNNHIKYLQKLNLINTEGLHRGKGGNTRKITSYFS